jgi:hypothetical protein
MSAHTPGPWHRRVGRLGNGAAASQHEQICNAEGIAVAMLEHDGNADGEANVTLMAAAPDLLFACLCVVSCNQGGNCEGCKKFLAAAVAKAKGEHP